MECRENPSITTTGATAAAVAVATSPSSFSPISSPTGSFSSFPPRPVSFSPCAACKILRRRCVDKCVLAPYFPPSEPLKFTIAHRVFGASNIIKLLQELPEAQRSDAVDSMVYDANARFRDPVYGCAGAICQLQKQISELQAELAKSQAEILNIQYQNANLVESIYQKMLQNQENSPQYQQDEDSRFFLDESFLGLEPLWT
ncbi:LOB domain-containing protein 1-like [Olea europaea var. sylvestris]|uniref:LOB domain-containing protein 1 n=1 Tax=Olea europaea subsp. europaea TaxID=158383 RepID=A0A8S0Q5P2_OLEEU|nr:LOB domain-containing protein 1-like [Olea europaea var. sylvestris]CAA2959926.1 LOB domain-containing protein 1 [Olea europaea subsp. europaea]